MQRDMSIHERVPVCVDVSGHVGTHMCSGACIFTDACFQVRGRVWSWRSSSSLIWAWGSTQVIRFAQKVPLLTNFPDPRTSLLGMGTVCRLSVCSENYGILVS